MQKAKYKNELKEKNCFQRHMGFNENSRNF